ncbi:MAG: hypothetical protein AAGD25_19405 [Cyanobacteria bacterium P01_F01_bin.150]
MTTQSLELLLDDHKPDALSPKLTIIFNTSAFLLIIGPVNLSFKAVLWGAPLPTTL